MQSNSSKNHIVHIQVQGENELSLLVYVQSTKREIRHFHGFSSRAVDGKEMYKKA